MDPLSITAGILAIVQVTADLLRYLNSVKDAPKDRAKCALEASNFNNLLTMLRYRLEDTGSNEPWFNALRALGVKDGLLDQYRQFLEELLGKLPRDTYAGNLSNNIIWHFRKEETNDLLGRIERLKTVTLVALEMDHL